MLDSSLPDGLVRERQRWRLEERRADDVDALRQLVFLVIDVAEPVYDGAIAEHIAVRLKLLAQVASDLVRVAERRLGLHPVLPRAVHFDRLVEQDVGGLVVFRPKVLLRLVLETAGVEPRVELCLAPPTAGILAGAALRGGHDVRAVHLVEFSAQAAVFHAVQLVDHFSELRSPYIPLLEDHQRRQDRRELELSSDFQEARPVLPHEREYASLGLYAIELLL